MDTVENSVQVLEDIKNSSENQKRLIAKEYVKSLTDSQYNVAEIAHQLALVVQEITESITRMDTEYFTQLLCFSEKVSKGLRIYTQQQNALKYFYFGQFQARIESFVKVQDNEIENNKRRKALSGKHAKEILKELYFHGECKQSELARYVNVDKGNLSREIEKLIATGLVTKRKLRKFCYYSLSPQAKRLCQKNSSILIHNNSSSIMTQKNDEAMSTILFPKYLEYYIDDSSESVSAKVGKYAVWDGFVEIRDFESDQWR